jgi:sugar fermentation stimulation protein A
LKLPQLQRGTLLRRYKRFLADVELEDGSVLTTHCPNTGAMTGCAEPGSPVWYSRSDNTDRKYPHTLEMVNTPAGYVSVNTGRANALVGEAIASNVIQELRGALEVKAEAKIPEGNGRFDFLVTLPKIRAWVEVKSTTLLVADGVGAFPDAVSSRALKHVEALVKRVQAGDRGVLIFCAQHCGIRSVRAAQEIHPEYAESLHAAIEQGVEVLAYGCDTDLRHMAIDAPLPFT